MARQLKKITFLASLMEYELLETYCGVTGRTKTDVLRELIRRLGTDPAILAPIHLDPLGTAQADSDPEETAPTHPD